MTLIRGLLFLGATVCWCLAASTGYADDGEWRGLPEGDGREEVFYQCQPCHSLKLVTQQGLDHDDWKETLEWMVEEQGMPEPEPEEWLAMLEYLTRFYGRDRLAAGMEENKAAHSN